MKSVIVTGRTGQLPMREKMDVGYGDSRAIRDGICYDEGRASARSGLSFTANPFRKDVQPDKYRSWAEGYSSFSPSTDHI